MKSLEIWKLAIIHRPWSHFMVDPMEVWTICRSTKHAPFDIACAFDWVPCPSCSLDAAEPGCVGCARHFSIFRLDADLFVEDLYNVDGFNENSMGYGKWGLIQFCGLWWRELYEKNDGIWVVSYGTLFSDRASWGRWQVGWTGYILWSKLRD